MLYLIAQILICLCFAAAIGFAVGWLLRGPGTRDEVDTLTEEWRLRESALRRDVERQREAAQDLERRLDDAQTAYRKAATGEEKLAQALNDAHRKARPESEALSQARDELERARDVGDKHRKQANNLAEALAESRERIEQLETELTAARSAPAADAEPPADMHEATARLAQIESQSIDRDKRILDLSRALEAATARTGQVEEQLAAARKALADQRQVAPAPQPERKRATAPTANLRQGDLLAPGSKPGEPAPAMPGTRPGWLLERPDGAPDDLKEIYGIGPVLEARLNQLGIYHFRQMAQLTANDVAWVAARINSFPDRIVRDRWVEQARRLNIETGNES